MGKGWVAALLALAVGCAGHKQETRADETHEATIAGHVQFVDDQSVMVEDPSQPAGSALLLSRGKTATVTKNDEEVAWSDLAQGDEVRVAYKESLSGPSEVQHVEILREADRADEAVPNETTGPRQYPNSPKPEPVPGTPATHDEPLNPPTMANPPR